MNQVIKQLAEHAAVLLTLDENIKEHFYGTKDEE